MLARVALREEVQHDVVRPCERLAGADRRPRPPRRFLMKRIFVAVALGAAVFAGSTLAGGQSSGPPSGTLSFKVRFTAQRNHQGINPAVPRNKKRPKVADLMAGNETLRSPDGQRIGRSHSFAVTTFEGARQYRGRAIQIENVVMDFGAANFLFGQCIAEDSPTNNNCAIIGGTGRYAGARGSAVVDAANRVEDKKTKTVTVPVTVTFIP
jgi:hypothetical protein